MKVLMAFPGGVLIYPEEEFEAVVDASHAVVDEAREAGVSVFSGGIAEKMDPGHNVPNGRFGSLELPPRKTARGCAVKIAVTCRCSQEPRRFQYDPVS